MEPPTYVVVLPLIGLFFLNLQRWSIFKKRITPPDGHERAAQRERNWYWRETIQTTNVAPISSRSN